MGVLWSDLVCSKVHSVAQGSEGVGSVLGVLGVSVGGFRVNEGGVLG